ncbi:MAG: diacylglycerol kinase family lipid kinase [Elusimicrobiaceae bacterium]|nr:diacylglycerol kinase family lipid kinase [Elusimicrobiaceae bacterium]
MKILFIINPKSGTGRDPQDTVNCIKLNFPQAAWALTTGPRHATELAAKAVSQQYEAVVAVGGDGTINETAQALVNTPTALGVVPGGSGNGFARELRMPLHLQEAVFCLQKAKTVRCDVGQANGELFLNLAGVGIEAQIAYDFMQYGKTGKRGMWPYFKLGAKDAFTYQPQEMQLEYDGRQETLRPLSVTFANGTQYGSNFKIAPQASLTDGWLEKVVIKNVHKLKLLAAAPTFFTDDSTHLGVTDTTRVKHVLLRQPGEIIYHLDGEPKKTQDQLEIKILPAALNVLIP